MSARNAETYSVRQRVRASNDEDREGTVIAVYPGPPGWTPSYGVRWDYDGGVREVRDVLLRPVLDAQGAPVMWTEDKNNDEDEDEDRQGMSKLRYKIEPSTVMGAVSAAIVLAGENPRTALVEDALNAISTDVQITAGGVTLHLAAWMDPDHWASDWDEALGEDADVESFIAGLVTQEQT